MNDVNILLKFNHGLEGQYLLFICIKGLYNNFILDIQDLYLKFLKIL